MIERYYLQDKVAEAPPSACTDYEGFRQAHTPICIDNGAAFFRAGWAGEAAPRVTAENVVARYRDRKTNTHIVLAGSAAYADANSKLNVKFPYEGDVVCAIDAVVCLRGRCRILAKIRGRNT
jgi:actin-related protein 5